MTLGHATLAVMSSETTLLRRRSRRLMAMLAGVWLLAACSNGPDAMMADYATRISRITEQPVMLPPASGAAYPRARDRSLPIPEVRARLFDLTDFERCNLTQLIAERNSIMGRYWPATQRLDYEYRFSHRLKACQAWLQSQDELSDDDRSLSEQVDALMVNKDAARPLAWWAATWASDEFARYFSASAAMPHVDATAPVAAFTPLATLIEGLQTPPAGIDLSQIEAALQTLRSDRYGGGWVKAMQAMTATLTASAAALNATDTARLCPQGQPTPRARIFETVFYRYYAEALQPYLASLHQQGQAQFTALTPLLDAVPPEAPEAFTRYAQRHLAQGPDSLWADMATARHQHTLAWQRLLRACGLMPDGPRPLPG